MTQCERILDYMQKFGSISTLEAFTDLGCTRLASRICDLRKSGITINSETVSGKNRFGETTYYKRYSLADEMKN